MKRFLVASHGNLAKEVLNSVYMIIGEKVDLDYICLLPSDSQDHVRKKIDDFLKKGGETDEHIILTDVFGGSVTNVCMEYTIYKNIHLITGFNLPMLLELFSSQNNMGVHELIKHCTERAKQGVIYVNELLDNKSKKAKGVY